MQKLFLVFLFVGLFAARIVFADHGEEAEAAAAAQAEQVTIADLGVQDPGTLPTSPFYFFKEWQRGIQSLFTFNKVAKAELEAKFSNEKAAELQAVQEQRPDDERGIARALSNYQKSQERLATRLERVQANSENPNVERLIEEIARKSVLHEKLLQEVQAKHEDKATVREFAREAGLKIAEVVRNAASKDNPEAFAERLRSSLAESRGGELKDLRAVEILDRIGESVPEEVRLRLDVVREGFKERAELKVEELAGEDRLEALLQLVPGDQGRRAVVLEELRIKVSDRAANALGRAQDALEEKLSGVEDRKEKAAEQIRRAGDMIEKARAMAREKGEARQAVTDLLAQAERHLDSAKQAFENADFGEAFGQARSAEVAARNALRALEGSEDSPAVLERVKVKIQERVNLPEPARPIESPIKPINILPEGRTESKPQPQPSESTETSSKERLELQLQQQLQQLNTLQRQLQEKQAE